ncbi:hypothetical protein SDC9_209413 [bioreactor metagenome]|uniref:Uncharacterized protein n=1 Tax=bioreactor metagenome TaxID=1076179 RepID=A0A645JDD6_9ZZZZ
MLIADGAEFDQIMCQKNRIAGIAFPDGALRGDVPRQPGFGDPASSAVGQQPGLG